VLVKIALAAIAPYIFVESRAEMMSKAILAVCGVIITLGTGLPVGTAVKLSSS
jgi:hypothetical protein